MTRLPELRRVRAGVLDLAYEETGPPPGVPVVLLHGFPYDVRAFDEVVAALGAEVRALVPYLRGYGPTRFLESSTPRSGQQAALASDLLALLDALGLERAFLGGFDWGGRAACIVAALHPERVAGLVTAGGYNVHDLSRAALPIAPEREHRIWYQYYLHGERGRAALETGRDAFCRHLWATWSPAWRFDEATFARTAASFANPDFVEVVIHSYRVRFALVAGDPAYDAMERAVATQPRIAVPTIALDGDTSGLFEAGDAAMSAAHFGAPYAARTLAGVGHNVPQEAPRAFAAALGELIARAR